MFMGRLLSVIGFELISFYLFIPLIPLARMYMVRSIFRHLCPVSAPPTPSSSATSSVRGGEWCLRPACDHRPLVALSTASAFTFFRASSSAWHPWARKMTVASWSLVGRPSSSHKGTDACSCLAGVGLAGVGHALKRKFS